MKREYKIDDKRVFRIVDDLDAGYLYEELWEGISFISNHRDYRSEGEFKKTELESKDDLKELEAQGLKVVPVHAYIHSGIVVSLGSFSCPWDSGLFGWLVFKEGEFGENDNGLTGFMRQWNALLMNEVYGFQVVTKNKCECCKHTEEEITDSCYGFYGYENDKEMIDSMLDHCLTKEEKTAFIKEHGDKL
jgi:hypothetical protein